MGSGLVHGVLQGELENAGTALLHVQKDIGLGAAPELASLIEWLNWPKYFLYSVLRTYSLKPLSAINSYSGSPRSTCNYQADEGSQTNDLGSQDVENSKAAKRMERAARFDEKGAHSPMTGLGS
jgi:hypothetical protein